MGNNNSVPLPDKKFTLYIPPFKAPFEGNLGRGIEIRITEQLSHLETNRSNFKNEKAYPSPNDWILFDPQNNTLIDKTMVQNSVKENQSYLVFAAQAAAGDKLWETVDKYLPASLRAALLKKRFEADTYPSDGSQSSENDGGLSEAFRTPDQSVTSDLIGHSSRVDATTKMARHKSPPPEYDDRKS